MSGSTGVHGFAALEAAELEAFVSYVRTKAARLLELGVVAYRAADAHGLPSVDWPEDRVAAVLSGCRQLVDGRGFEDLLPLEGLGVPGCYALLHTFHFEVAGQRAFLQQDAFLDEMRCLHVGSGSFRGVLFNRVVMEPRADPTG